MQCKAYRKANNPAFTDTARMQYAQQGLCNGRESVRLSVCPIDRQRQRRPAGLLLSSIYGQEILCVPWLFLKF